MTKMTDRQLLEMISQEILSIKNSMATKDDIAKLNTRMDNLEGQARENTDMIKALIHRTDELDAKFDGLLLTTATKESIAGLEANMATKEDMARAEAKIDSLNVRIYHQETDIQLLKKVK